MTRVKRGNVARKRRRKVLQVAEGFRGSSALLFRTANQHVLRSLAYSSRDRHQRKRSFRQLWISRIGGAARGYGLNYNHLLCSMRGAKLLLNRKMLAQIAVRDREEFASIVSAVQD